MKRLSWKYIAGFVDGEGCIDFQMNKNPKTGLYTYLRPRVRIGLSEPGKEVLELLKANHGGNIHLKNIKGHAKYNENWATHHYWTIEGKRARPFLQNIVNHLIIKKEQARLAIMMIDHLMGKHLSEEIRELLRSEMKAMKVDPQRLSEQAVEKVLQMR